MLLYICFLQIFYQTNSMILPGSTVKVTDENSIYRGYVGCVQRIQGKKAAVLMDSHTPWDKMITFRISELDEVTEGFQ